MGFVDLGIFFFFFFFEFLVLFLGKNEHGYLRFKNFASLLCLLWFLDLELV